MRRLSIGVCCENPAHPEPNKGNETGNIKKDGYRVTARSTDDYQKDMRRGYYGAGELETGFKKVT